MVSIVRTTTIIENLPQEGVANLREALADFAYSSNFSQRARFRDQFLSPLEPHVAIMRDIVCEVWRGGKSKKVTLDKVRADDNVTRIILARDIFKACHLQSPNRVTSALGNSKMRDGIDDTGGLSVRHLAATESLSVTRYMDTLAKPHDQIVTEARNRNESIGREPRFGIPTGVFLSIMAIFQFVLLAKMEAKTGPAPSTPIPAAVEVPETERPDYVPLFGVGVADELANISKENEELAAQRRAEAVAAAAAEAAEPAAKKKR